MIRFVSIACCTAVYSFAAEPGALAQRSRIDVSQVGQPCHLPYVREPLRCLTVDVPLDWKLMRGRLQLHVTIAPSVRESATADPLFVLAGGPGQAGSDVVALLNTAFRKVRATRDIVFVDQRGTGRSGKLSCADLEKSEYASDEAQNAAIELCLRSLKASYEFYTTDSAANDLNRVREILGFSHINLWGGSYGTRLAQAYARLFPEHVRSLVLDGVVSPQQIVGAWGLDGQRSFEGILKRCEIDPACHEAFPALRAEFEALSQKVKANEVKLKFRHPRTSQHADLTNFSYAFFEGIRVALYRLDTAAQIPFFIHEAHENRWQPFLAHLYSTSDWSSDAMAIGLTLAVVCAEDMPRVTADLIAEEEKGSFLRGLHLKTWPTWCNSLNVPEVPWKTPSALVQPTLMLSGGLDPVTPPSRAEEAAQFLKSSTHVIVANAGHGVSSLGCIPKLIRKFLDAPTQSLDTSCIETIPTPSLVVGPAGPRP